MKVDGKEQVWKGNNSAGNVYTGSSQNLILWDENRSLDEGELKTFTIVTLTEVANKPGAQDRNGNALVVGLRYLYPKNASGSLQWQFKQA